ncbi:RNA polymerase sigma-70 factor, ECF subfamily [Parasphingorhabdus marina DSM 22363]|uniref:RNA polymerase sigma-70 factor, ECF subfamily n=1 Tax=Parasphingorhabdus marina DSM 22363 TaxID=1123272 RepID=A0A1N6H7N3_9SPHN|nr:sigma-70 family RNA polymerase sigma factor [Parasphingorhabdus marina]SIO15779.1 RNA polymerase sigma-70 factor, ECF subfamily [Parasphingorhabdus marina DSM 22363]
MREQRQYPQAASASGFKGSATVNALPGRGDRDAYLMQRIVKASDRSALEDIASHYAPRLKAWLMYRGEQSSTAEDIAQDVIIQVWVKAGKFDPAKGTFSVWVFRMTRNCWIDHKRKHDRLQPTSPDIMSIMADAPVDAADVAVDQNEAAEAVQSELARLPLDQKQMLHLAFFEGLSHSQIAERTGLALGTVKSRIRAPLKKMQNRLENFRGVNR